ncbi:MAG: hypothetical protein JNJ88_14010 [Planctomycetes bacterium]|nr:hypothetical protein [Planctomycetota bacterium]
MVIVVWHLATAKAWSAQRKAVEPRDLRLMHYLHQVRWATTADLEERFSRRAAAGGLERLQQANMIRRAGDSWTPRALRASFAATKIIAIEAKVDRWSDAIAQAVLNTWFASKSYVLVPNAPSSELLHAAKRFGLGVCSLNKESVREVATPNGGLPRSYASWLLNEWAWQAWRGAKDSPE